MAAADIQIVTIVLPNPQFDQSRGAKVVQDPGLAYLLRLNSGFQTLSNNNPNNYDTIEGVLYTPTIDNTTISNSCPGYRSIVPANVTTINSFPTNQNWPLTAVFPWGLSDDCTSALLAQARFDAVRNIITFQANAGDAPGRGDPSWLIRGNDSWRGDNQFPIYAINSATGSIVMANMGIYSGNMSTVPNSRDMSNQFDARNFPRLFSHVDLIGGTNVPSLWVFLIIVLGVLLGIVIIASIIMHIIQRYQRRNLQRRLARGEVDLETLGIKKMNVPQEMIDKMPKYTYTDTAAPVVPATSASTDEAHVTSFSQTVCAVCLDDFVSKESEVRELPCKHIFHPECIDLFLRDSSSLCPICKQSALPAGYCPVKVTNLMVRRERLVRRMRERREANAVAAAQASGEMPPPTPSTFPAWIRHGWQGRGIPPPPRAPYSGAARHGDATITTAPTSGDVELGTVPSQETPADPARTLNTRRQTMAVPSHIAAQGPAARRAWRRERLARQEEELYNQQAETTRAADVGRPLWRRVAGRVVPGLD